MDFKDVPHKELETETYSRETISGLLEREKREYSESLKKSASKNLPLLLGSYLVVCACLGGFALSYDESIWLFVEIYLALAWLWLAIGLSLVVKWYLHRPTESKIREELAWYRELSKAATFDA